MKATSIGAVGYVLGALLVTTEAVGQRLVPGIDFFNDRMPISESERFDDGVYTELGRILAEVARLMYFAGNYVEAADKFELALREYSYKAENWVFVARSYFHMKSPERAKQTLEAAQEQMPDLRRELWQPLIASLLNEMKKRAHNQQVEADFYSPSHEDLFSLFRLYIFLKDYEGAVGVIESVRGRGMIMDQRATAVSGNTRKSYLKEAKQWYAFGDELVQELSGHGVAVPEFKAARRREPPDHVEAFQFDEATRILQLKVDFYRAEADDFRALFQTYWDNGDDERSEDVVESLAREIQRLKMRAAVAPSAQDEASILQLIEKLEQLDREMKSTLKSVSASG